MLGRCQLKVNNDQMFKNTLSLSTSGIDSKKIDDAKLINENDECDENDKVGNVI